MLQHGSVHLHLSYDRRSPGDCLENSANAIQIPNIVGADRRKWFRAIPTFFSKPSLI